MIDAYFVTGTILGAFLVIAFAVRCWISDIAWPDLADGIQVFLGGGGVIAGFKACIIALSARCSDITALDHTVVFIGGLAVLWSSVWSVGRLIKDPTH